MSDDAKCYAATPAATLEQHITDSNVPKNEAEWWAYHEITRLRAELSDERERADKAEAQFDRLAERHREAMVTCGAEMDSARKLRAELAAVKADCEHGYSLAEVRLAERDALREENARLREALKPFAGILKGNYSHQSDDMPIKAGANQYDLVFVFTLGDLRAAAAAIREGET